MLVKKCGLDAVKEVMPEEHMKLLTNIRKVLFIADHAFVFFLVLLFFLFLCYYTSHRLFCEQVNERKEKKHAISEDDKSVVSKATTSRYFDLWLLVL